ncbi:MAG: PAS domain S-box protein, partial [Candidatus Aminicenantes bacterium]|nr:PAS domain S-box protein [Candidatus Aminicenantes bacterium]
MDKNRNFSKSSDLTIQTIIDSLEHPFYIINVSDYSIILSNKAAKLNIKTKKNTCFELTHNFKKPCNTILHKWPIEIIKKSKKPESLEHVHFDKYGKERILKISAIPIFDNNGELHQIIEYSYDITAAKKKDIELKKQEIKFKNLIDNSNDGVYLLYEGRFEITNKSFRDMFGVTEEEVVSDLFNFMRLISPKSISAIEKRNLQLRNGEKVEDNYIFTAIGNGGHEIEVEVSASYINYKSGVATLGNIRDITKRRQIEQRLLQAQKLESLGELAGGITHDFNNILGSIYGYAELAVDKLSEESKTRYYVEQVLKSAEKGKDLVNHIMSFTRKGNANMEDVNLGETIKECMKLIKPLLPSTIRIRQNIQTDQSFISGNSTHIYQIFINLCTNASYAMGGNTGLIGITLDEIKLNDKSHINTSLKSGKYIRLIVSDTGSGMSIDAQQKIFDPFFTTKPIGEGTGMGLSVV